MFKIYLCINTFLFLIDIYLFYILHLSYYTQTFLKAVDASSTTLVARALGSTEAFGEMGGRCVWRSIPEVLNKCVLEMVMMMLIC